MSFVKKAVKKVFKKVKSFVKRLVKSKWFKIALVVALTVFTAGVGAAGGWAAFASQAFGSGISGFFSAVGSTMAQGFSSIVASLKSFGTAAKSFLTGGGAQTGTTAAAQAGASAVSGEIGVAGIGIEGATAATSGSVMSAANQAAAVTAQQAAASGMTAATAAQGTAGLSALPGVVVNSPATAAAQKSIVGRVLGTFASNSPAGSMLRSGTIMAFDSYQKNAAMKEDRKRWKMRNIAGGYAIGGPDDYGYTPLQIDDGSGTPSDSGIVDQGKAGQMAQQEIVTPHQKAQQGQESSSPFLLDAPPAFQPTPTDQDKQMAQMQRPDGQQPPPATQPVEGREPGLLSGNLGVA